MNFNDHPELGAWLRSVAFILLSAFGGVMGHLMRTIDKKERIHWGRALVEGFAAGFVGFLVLQLCEAMKLSSQWTGVIVGVTGWLGANATIRILEKVIWKKLGLEKNNPTMETAHGLADVNRVDGKEPRVDQKESTPDN